MNSFLYVTTNESEIEEMFWNLFKEYNIFPEYFPINAEHGEEMEKRIGFNPMLSIKFDESVAEKIIDMMGARMHRDRRFAHLEKGVLSKSYTEAIIPKQELQEGIGPRLG